MRGVLGGFFKSLITYFILSILGCYFIHKGEVFNRFRFGKTFFAEYDEQVSELPTILTYIEGPTSRSNLKYGKDFNLSLAWGKLRTFIGEEEDPSINILNLGENSIPFGTEIEPLRIDLEALWDGTVFRISPLNLPAIALIQRQELTYIFENPSPNTTVNLQLTTKTGGTLDGGEKRFNSNEELFQAGIKKLTTITFWPEKHRFLKSKGCHPDPVDSSNYIQILETNRTIHELYHNFTVCKPQKQSFGKLLNKILQPLPDFFFFCKHAQRNDPLGYPLSCSTWHRTLKVRA